MSNPVPLRWSLIHSSHSKFIWEEKWFFQSPAVPFLINCPSPSLGGISTTLLTYLQRWQKRIKKEEPEWNFFMMLSPIATHWVNIDKGQQPFHLVLAQPFFAHERGQIWNHTDYVLFHHFISCKVKVWIVLVLPGFEHMRHDWSIRLKAILESLGHGIKVSGERTLQFTVVIPWNTGIFGIPAHIDNLEVKYVCVTNESLSDHHALLVMI